MTFMAGASREAFDATGRRKGAKKARPLAFFALLRRPAPANRVVDAS
jgi:hypothetical protein